MSLMRPVATLAVDGVGGGLGAGPATLAGGALDLREAGVITLDVRLDTGTGHDRFEALVSHLSPIAETEPGTTVQVALAAHGDPVDVLGVEILGVDDRPDGIHLTGFAPSHRLSGIWLSRTFVRQSVADVVNDLLSEGDVEAGTIDGGLALEQYHVDGRRSAWETVHQLAQLVGAEVTSDDDGALSFRPAPGADSGGLGGALAGAASSVASALGVAGNGGLRRGANLLAWESGARRAEPTATIAVAPLGAASTVGTTGAHHLLKQPEAGGAQEFVAPAIRTADGASTASTARRACAARRRRGGRFATPGDPTQRPGDDIDVDGDTWHVVAVHHRIDALNGFVTESIVEGTP